MSMTITEGIRVT